MADHSQPRRAQSFPDAKDAPNLDILRALAVLLVFADHLIETVLPTAAQWHEYAWYMGRMGVLLFFVHTSLVLMYSMRRLDLSGMQLLRVFMTRRIFRIYPLAVVCIVAVIVWRVPRAPWESFQWVGWSDFISNLALTMNLTHSRVVLAPLWSLPIEIQMYCALPLAFLLLNRAQSPRLCVASLWAASIVFALALPYLPGQLSVLYFAPCFMAGVIAFVLQSGTAPHIAGRWWPLFLASVICGYTGVEVLTPGIHHPPLQWAFCLLVGAAIPRFLESKATMLNRAAAQVAKYSYGIYLFHCVGLWLGFVVLADQSLLVQAIVAVAFIAAASVAGYRWIEKPAMDLGARLSKRPSKKAAAPVGAV